MESGVRPSLNEVEGLTMKAGRGAGLGWGEAEDLGRAARWLAERSFDWAGALVGLLRNEAELRSLKHAFRAADRAFGAEPGYSDTVEFCRPVWVAAILAPALDCRGLVLTLRCGSRDFRFLPDASSSADAPGPDLTVMAPQRTAVAVSHAGQPPEHRTDTRPRRPVSNADWGDLEGYAARTYVPASAQSRARGAGTGRTDDD